MKEKLPLTEWPDNLQMQTSGGHPMSIYQKDEMKQEKLLNNAEVTFGAVATQKLSVDPAAFEISIPKFTDIQTQKCPIPNDKPLTPTETPDNWNNTQLPVMPDLSEDIEIHKKYDKKSRDSGDTKCLCFSVNGTCVGVVGVFLLIGLAAALLSVPGSGRMPETIPMYIKDIDKFMVNYNNDPYNYTFRALKHIRSYMRYSFIRKDDIPRSFVSITFQLGWIDDHLSRESGITQLLFDQLPYESFFMRSPEKSHFFRLINRCGATFSSKVESLTSQIDVSLPNYCLKEFIQVFTKYYGFGHSSVPLDMHSYLRDLIQTKEAFERHIVLLPSQDEFFPKFSTGSISTLNRTDIQDKLWDFYDQYYSANLITVAIIGNETLDTLEEWAEEIFAAIPNKDKVKPVFNVLPFPPGDRRYITRRVYYQPKSDKDGLQLIFPVNIRGYPNLSYLTYLLAYEGKGSIYQYLSTRGFVTSLVTNIPVEAENFVLVSIFCDLTVRGLKDPNVIVEALFKFVKRVKEGGIDEELWQENKKIDELKFKFKEKEDPAIYASTISARMARVTDPRDYLDPPSRRIYNKTLEEEILSYITPENMNMYIGSLKLSGSEDTEYGPRLTQLEKWYSTPHENIGLLESDIENWKNVPLEEELTLPPPNPFIPDDFIILEVEGSDLPVQVTQSTGSDISDLTIWWYQDPEFNQPKIHMRCQLHPVRKPHDIRDQLLNKMLSRIFRREAAESLYPAETVDYSLDIIFGRYWSFNLAGFSDADKVEKVIHEGLDSLFRLDFEQDEGHFNATVREPIRKYYLNIQNLDPAQQSLRNARMLQEDFFFDYPEAIEALDTLSQMNVKSHRDSFLDNIDIDCSIIGNVLSSQAASYVEIMKNKLVTDGLAKIVKEDRLGDFVDPIHKLPTNKTIVIRKKAMNPEEPNSAVVTVFQIGPTESNGPYLNRSPYHRTVLVILLQHMMSEPCFNYLRTQQQLGYVAQCFTKQFDGVFSFNVIVQGSREDAGAFVIANEHDKFIDLQYKKFIESSKTAEGQQMWADIKLALNKKLEEKPISLSEKNEAYNDEIFSEARDFGRKEKQMEALEAVTMADFLEFYQRYLTGGERRKISSQVYGKGDTPHSTVDAGKGEVLVTDSEKYKNENLSDTFTEDD